MKLIVLYPPPPGKACGVRDHSHELMRQAESQGWTASAYEYYDGACPPLSDVLPRSGDVLVILQLVFFGLHRYGMPWHLIRYCQDMQRQPNVRVVACFHEVPLVAGNPLVAALRAHLQWEIARRIASGVEAVVVNQMTGMCLKDRHGRAPVFLPTFSNVGELASFDSQAIRRYDEVVFGTPGRRQRVYERLRDASSLDIGGRRIRHIADVGPPVELPEFLPESGVVVESFGICTNEQVSSILADSWAGLFSTPPNQATKSGVLAAYCAHGVLPVNVEEHDGTSSATHLVPFISLGDLPVTQTEALRVRNDAYQWSCRYPREHALLTIANAACPPTR